MKLNVYSKNNARPKKEAKIHLPEIRFYRSGTVWITNKALELMGAEVGDMVLIAQNKERLSEWWIYMVEEGDGIVLQAGKSTKAALFIQHSTIVKDMFDYCKKTRENTNSITISVESKPLDYLGHKLFPISVLLPKVQPRKEPKKRKPKAA